MEFLKGLLYILCHCRIWIWIRATRLTASSNGCLSAFYLHFSIFKSKSNCRLAWQETTGDIELPFHQSALNVVPLKPLCNPQWMDFNARPVLCFVQGQSTWILFIFSPNNYLSLTAHTDEIIDNCFFVLKRSLCPAVYETREEWTN